MDAAAPTPGKEVLNIPVKKVRTLHEIKKHTSIYLFISPFYILFLVFGLFPILFSLFLSLQSWDGLDTMKFIGFKNFQMLLQDGDFWQAVGNTFTIWFEQTIIMLFLSLVIAFLLNSAFVKLRSVWRFTYFLPNVTSLVAQTVLFYIFFSPKYGTIDYFIQKAGVAPIDWLNSNFWLQISIAIIGIWRWTGYNALIYLAGLQSIPDELYEAAKIDGATTTQSFFRITIPILRPIVLFTVIMSTIGGMQIFTEPQILTGGNGGPGGGGMTMVLYLYNQAFSNHLFGYASAIAWVLFIIILIFSLVNSLIIRRLSSK
ncbi:MAG: cytochrome biosis protein [Bacilli bacterium]|nr:cytochrome biosis protein [Bacilli bacterium]